MMDFVEVVQFELFSFVYVSIKIWDLLQFRYQPKSPGGHHSDIKTRFVTLAPLVIRYLRKLVDYEFNWWQRNKVFLGPYREIRNVYHLRRITLDSVPEFFKGIRLKTPSLNLVHTFSDVCTSIYHNVITDKQTVWYTLQYLKLLQSKIVLKIKSRITSFKWIPGIIV